MTVAENRNRELLARQIRLDEHRLGVGREQMRDLADELRAIPAEALYRDALPGSLESRLHEQRKRERHMPRIVRRTGQHEGRGGYSAMREDLFASRLMQGEAQRERIRSMAGHAEELADCRDVRLAIRPIEPFGDVEHEVGAEQRESGREAGVGLEAIDLTHGAQRPLHRIDGGGLIPLGVQVWLRKVWSESPTGRLVGRGGVGVRPGWSSRRRRFEIKGESYPNCQRDSSTKKAVCERRAETSATIDVTKVRKMIWSHNSFLGKSRDEFWRVA